MQIIITPREVSAIVAQVKCLAICIKSSNIISQCIVEDLDEGIITQEQADSRRTKLMMAETLIDNPTALEAIVRMKLPTLSSGPLKVTANEDGSIAITIDEKVMLVQARMYTAWFYIYHTFAVKLMRATYSLARVLSFFKRDSAERTRWNEEVSKVQAELAELYKK